MPEALGGGGGAGPGRRGARARGGAFGAMLGRSAPLWLLATVVGPVLSPLYLPPFASWLAGYQLYIDPVARTESLLLIVGGACACATLLRRYAGRFVAQNPHAMT